jgi:hypothetical protein
MTKIIADLRREGWTITRTCPSSARISPPGLKRFGEYMLDPDRDLEPSIQEILSRRKKPPVQSGSCRMAKEA